jgi:hypothetical protein
MVTVKRMTGYLVRYSATYLKYPVPESGHQIRYPTGCRILEKAKLSGRFPDSQISGVSLYIMELTSMKI